MFIGPLSIAPAIVVGTTYAGCAALFATRALIAMRQGLAWRVATLSATAVILSSAAIYHVALALGVVTFVEAWQMLNLFFAVALFAYVSSETAAEIRAFHFINGHKEHDSQES